MILRAIAGVFSGVGGLIMIYYGITQPNPEALLGGSLLISNMFTFFIGEYNGKKAST